MKWKLRRSDTPRDLRSSTTVERFVRWISGTVVASSCDVVLVEIYVTMINMYDNCRTVLEILH